MTFKPFKVYSPLYEETFICDSVHEDISGNPLLVCHCDALGIERMIFSPLEIQCNEAFLRKRESIE